VVNHLYQKILNKKYNITSNEAFYLDDLPKNVTIVGGGYIAIELPNYLKRRKDFLNIGAYILNWLFEIAAPQPPLGSQERISNFIIEVLRSDSESVDAWNLLHTALTLDLINFIKCVHPSYAELIGA